MFILSFVDNGLFIAYSKSLSILNDFFFCSYSITSLLLKKLGFLLKHEKTEVFYFSKTTNNFDLSLLDFSVLEDFIF